MDLINSFETRATAGISRESQWRACMNHKTSHNADGSGTSVILDKAWQTVSRRGRGANFYNQILYPLGLIQIRFLIKEMLIHFSELPLKLQPPFRKQRSTRDNGKHRSASAEIARY